MRSIRRAFKILASLVLLSGFVWVLPAAAQDNFGVNQLASLGLPGGPVTGVEDVRILIGNIIRALLGFLGLLALGIVIYGGYVWMTAGGNSERVERARKILINGAIGLALIIFSYIIVSFIINQFTAVVTPAESCTVGEVRGCGNCGSTQECIDPDLDGVGEWEACPVVGFCGPGDDFSILSYSPRDRYNDGDYSNDDYAVNSVVVIRFDRNVEDITSQAVQDHFTVTADGNNVAGTVVYETDREGNDKKYLLKFIPDQTCDLDATQKCFDKNVIVTVTVAGGLAGLQSEAGDPLYCPVNGCTWSFGIGEGFDRDNPTVSIIAPRNQVAVGVSELMTMLARDDFALGRAWFEVADGEVVGSVPGQEQIGPDIALDPNNLRRSSATSYWNTSSIVPPFQTTFTAYVDDLANRGPVWVTEDVTVVALHCTNGQLDALQGEEDIDCGPPASGCVPCGAPIITGIKPADAAPGDYVQITGRNFGDDPGEVTFFDNISVGDELGLEPIECVGFDTWQDNQIITQVPTFTVDENNDGTPDIDYIFDTHIEVSNLEGNSGDTSHWSPKPLTINTAVVRPSICGIAPNEIKQCDLGEDRLTRLVGRKFGGNAADNTTWGNVLFGNETSVVKNWVNVPLATSAEAYVPGLLVPSIFGVQVENTEQKYCVGGLNAWTPCLSQVDCSSNVCEYPKSNPVDFTITSCIPRPEIIDIDPPAGPNNQIVTILGRNFGSSPREVLFVDSGGNETSASFEFPAQCGATDYWKESQIIAKVPPNIATGNYSVKVVLSRGANGNESDPYSFVINSNPLTPGLVCAIPDNGPEDTPIQLVGEAFGDAAQQGVVVFNSNTSGPIDSWSQNIIETKVPELATSGPLFMVRLDGQNSNSLAFTVGSCSVGGCANGQVCCGDGSCRVSADLCDVPPPLPLSSYRWRVTTGDPAPRVIEQAQCLVNLVQNWSFENYDDVTKSPTVWNTVAPTRVVEGDASINNASLQLSGGAFQDIPVPVAINEVLALQFSAKGKAGDVFSVDVSNNTDNIIYETLTISADDVWEKFSFSGISPSSGSSLGINFIRFNVNPILLDGVSLQSSSSETATTQSPAPYINTRSACTNSALSARFTTNLASLGIIKIAKCDPNDASCQNLVDEQPLTTSSLGLDGIVAYPLNPLEPEQWYKATIEGVTSDRGVSMLEPYSWTFRTGDGACAIGGASCSPNKHTLTSSVDNVNLNAALQALNCNILTCANGDITWEKLIAESDDVTTLGFPPGVCSVPVSVRLPNPEEGTDKIRPQVTGNPNAVVGMCTVNVKFAPLKVVGSFPQCNSACTNSRPVLAFSVPVKTVTGFGQTFLEPGTYSIKECADSQCQTVISELSSGLVWREATSSYTPTQLRNLNLPYSASYQYFDLLSLPTGGWNPDTYYEIIINPSGGPVELKSVDNKPMDGQYRWVFKTKDRECTVTSVSLAPEEVIVDVIGAKANYAVSPYGTPDECAPGGQLLMASDYNYDWSIAPFPQPPNPPTDPRIADLTRVDTNPADTRIDPIQTATAIGTAPECVQGDNTCIADIQTFEVASGSADTAKFGLQCGFTPSGECKAVSISVLENGNLEADPIGDNIPGFYGLNCGPNGPAGHLIPSGGVVGNKYFKHFDGNEKCDANLIHTFNEPLVEGGGYVLEFYAKSTETDVPTIVLTVDRDDHTNLAFATVNLPNELTEDWTLFRYEMALPKDSYYFEVTFDDMDIDGLSLSPKRCTNNSDLSCSTSNDCNANLNTCGNGTTDGTCVPSTPGSPTGLCSNNDFLTCRVADNDPANGNINGACRLAVNPVGCCGVRPYVTDIGYADYDSDGNGINDKICLNSGFEVDFNSLMDPLSFNDNVKLEWKDTVVDPKVNPGDPDLYEDCDLTEQLAYVERGFFARIFAFIKSLFGFNANALGNAWCGVEIKTTTITIYDEITKQPKFTKLLIYPAQLLNKNLEYRIVVDGETVDNPTGGVRNIYSIPMFENRSLFREGGNFVQLLSYLDSTNTLQPQVTPAGTTLPLIGDIICEIDHITIDVAPQLPQDSQIISTPIDPRDLFQCVGDNCNCATKKPGEPGCRIVPNGSVSEDQDGAAGNQHNYQAVARTANGRALSADWQWSKLDPLELISSISNETSDQTFATINSGTPLRYGLAKLKIDAKLKGVPVASASNFVNIVFDRCEKPWAVSVNVPRAPLIDGDNNFQTTYCRDTETGELPNFWLSNKYVPSTNNNPLGIRGEWILRHPFIEGDAIAFRVVENKLHLTPLEWYSEQPFEKGSPQIIEGGIDGYPAIKDGRTAYISFGNVADINNNIAGEELYTNILIVSHAQGASEETVEVFNRLLNNLTFNTNKLSVGQCRGAQELICVEGSDDKLGESCRLHSDCGNNGLCTVALQDAVQKRQCVAGDADKLGDSCVIDANCGVGGDCELVNTGGRGCLVDTDCGTGFLCTSDKSEIIRDVDRFTKLLDIQSALIDYQYGSSCPSVTPGAPGDADCNGVINGQDVLRASQLIGYTPKDYCTGADYNLSGGEITQTDVGAIRDFVQRNCSRPADRLTRFPSLNEGTFVENMTTSVWPSWTETFGQQLQTQLPVDPINLFSVCGVEDIANDFALPHSPYTCWDPASKTYASYNAQTNSPANTSVTGNATYNHDGDLNTAEIRAIPDIPHGRVVDGQDLYTHVFTYAAYENGNNYALCTYMESGAVPSPVAAGQVTASTLGNNRLCVLSDIALSNNLPPAPNEGDLETGIGFNPVPVGSTVNLRVSGGGSGDITMQHGAETINCQKSPLREATCSIFVPLNPLTTLTLDAPDNDFTWENCPGTLDLGNRCVINPVNKAFYNISAELTGGATLTIVNSPVDASFSPTPTYSVSRNGQPDNCVPTGVSTCSFETGDNIVISPNLGTNIRFKSWEAGTPCVGQGQTCSFVIEGDTNIDFVYQERKKVLLTEINAVGGEFGGTLTSTPSAIDLDCSVLGQAGESTACREIDLFSEGTIITLQAMPDPNSNKRVIWEGCDVLASSLPQDQCQVTMNRDKTVRARFVDIQPGLTVIKSGGDPGASIKTISATLPALNCESGCGSVTQNYERGTTITLEATPSIGAFSNWTISGSHTVLSGSCGTNTICSLSIEGAATVTANFDVPIAEVKIKRSPTNGGTTVVTPAVSADNSCGPGENSPGQPTDTCVIQVPANTDINITSSANTGYTFLNVSNPASPFGTCAFSGTCDFGNFANCGITGLSSSCTGANAFYIQANYDDIDFRLTVQKNYNGSGVSGSVATLSPSTGINCGTDCEEDYGVDEVVTLRATASSGSVFTGWSSNCTLIGASPGNPGDCRITMDAAKTVTANFAKNTHLVTVTATATGPSGSKVLVKIDDGDGNLSNDVELTQVSAGPASSFAVDNGLKIYFVPSPASGASHSAWGGSCSSAIVGSLCGPKTITGPISVTADFLGQQTLTVRKLGLGVGDVIVFNDDINSPDYGDEIARFEFVDSEDDMSVQLNQGQKIKVQAEYPNPTGYTEAWITTFQCPGGTNNPPVDGTTFCPTYEMGASGATATVRFNTPPEFDDIVPPATWSVLEDIPLENSILGTDGNYDGGDYGVDTYTIEYTQPTNGTVNCLAVALTPLQPPTPQYIRSRCTYTPNANYYGPDSFTYRFLDGHYDTVFKTVNIDVVNDNDPPVIELTKCSTPATNSVGLGFVDDCLNSNGVRDGQTMELYCQATDPDGDTLTYEWVQTSTRGIGGSIANTSNPFISVPVRSDVGVANVGSTKSAVLNNTAQGGVSSVSYSIDSSANALVVTYQRTPTTPSPTGDTNVWWPDRVVWQPAVGAEVSLKRIVASGNGGNSIAGIAVYYWGPGVTGFSPLPTGSGNIRVTNHISSQLSGTHGVSIATFSGVVGVGDSGAKNSSTASGTGDETLNLTLNPLSSSLLVGGFVMKNTNADTDISGAQQLSTAISASGAAQMRYGFLSATNNSVDIQSSGTNTNQISYGLGLIELQREVLTEYNTAYQCKVSDPSGLSDTKPVLPGVEITRLLP